MGHLLIPVGGLSEADNGFGRQAESASETPPQETVSATRIERTMPDNEHPRDVFTAGVPAAGAVPREHDRPPAHRDRNELEPDVVARLEMLDDVIFAAIDGDAVALEMAADTWHAALAELGPATVDESRRQYLRHAQTVWETLRHEPNHPPHRLFAAIEIISLLSGRGDCKR